MTALDPVAWLHAFRQQRPRCYGVPLYEHRCTSEEFEQLARVLRRVPRSRAGWMCFALFASEWLRRHFDGGEWTYRGVFAALGWPTDQLLDYDDLEQALEVGWGVEVLHSNAGREFFATLVLQAMPLRAVLGSRGALASCVPRLVRAAAEGASHAGLQALAAAHADSLPLAWREPAALELVVGIAEQLRHTDLRQLELVDEQRVALEQAATRKGPTIALRRSIVERSPGHFEWQVRLVCPERVDEDELLRALGLGAPPSGSDWELFVQSSSGDRIRIGSLSPDPLRDAHYIVQRDEIPPECLTRLDCPLELVALRGEQLLGPRTLSDRQPLDALPWVFARSSDDEWEFVGQGDVARRETLALVTLPPDATFDLRTIPRRIGLLGERPIFECTTSVAIRSGSSGWQLRVAASRDASSEYVLQGERLGEPVVGQPVYGGMPTLIELIDGRQRRVSPGALRWRARGHVAWRSDLAHARGVVELSCVQQDALCWQGRVRVAPPGLRVTTVAIDESRCELRLDGLERGVEVSLHASHELRMIERGRWEVCFRDTSPRIDVTLRWSNETSLRFTCHVPRSTLGFELVGVGLLDDRAELGLDELHLVRAFASGARRADARLILSARIGTALSESVLPLPERGPLELLRIRDRLRTMLAANLCIEAAVSLTLDDGVTRRKARVRRWSRRIHCEEGRVTLSSREGELDVAALSGIEVEARSFIDPEQRDLLERDGNVFDLSRTHLGDETLLLVARRGARVWACPRACGRPATASAHDHDSLPCSTEQGLARRATLRCPSSNMSLADALRLSNKADRCAALDGVLARLVADHRDPDWRILDAYVATLGDIHASTFDIFERFLHQPAIAAGLLLRARVHDFDRIWLALEELPFSWNLVAIRDWMRAAGGLLDAWQREGVAPLELLVDHFERVRDMATRRSRAAQLVFSCLLAALFGRSDAHRQLAAIHMIAPTLLGDREHAMQTLLRTVDEWPRAPTTSRLAVWIAEHPDGLRHLVVRPPAGCGFRAPLLAGPCIAALLVVDPDALAPGIAEHRLDIVELLTELRLLEAGHGDWFRECFALTLQLAAAQHRHTLFVPEASHV